MRVNEAQPMLQATPNSVILTPCDMKLNIVIANSGIRFPTATRIPVQSFESLYLTDMFKREGRRYFSANNARKTNRYIEKITSMPKKVGYYYRLLYRSSHLSDTVPRMDKISPIYLLN